MGDWTIYVRNSSLETVAELDDYQRLTQVLQFNAPSRWVLECNAAVASAKGLLDPGAGIVVQKGNTTVLSGPATLPEREWDRRGNRLTLAGPDDTIWLPRRLAYPVPGGPPYAAAEHDVQTGAAETVMRHYVDVNVGPSASVPRRVPGLTLAADGGLGATVTGRARFDPLIDLLASLALAGGDLGFRIVQVGAGIQFQVYQPTDKTGTAVFSSELGNLEHFRYSVEAAEANYVICGGGGEGTARTFAEKGDSASIVRWGRIEMFRDRRDTTDAAEMAQTIDEELAQRAERTSLEITPADTAGLAYLMDYGLGDQVTVVIDGEAVTGVLRTVNITLTPDEGVQVQPVVGTPGATTNPVQRILDSLRRIGGRVGSLERR